MSDLQKMLYLLASTEAEPNLIEKMMYLLQEPDETIPKVTTEVATEPIATQIAVPVPVVDGVELSTELERETEPITYDDDCSNPNNQDIIADFITIDGKKGTKRCITGADIKE